MFCILYSTAFPNVLSPGEDDSLFATDRAVVSQDGTEAVLHLTFARAKVKETVLVEGFGINLEMAV